jgi:hypothetical protein
MAAVYRNGILNICVYACAPYPRCLQARNPLSRSLYLLAKSNDSLLVAGADLNPILELIGREIYNASRSFRNAFYHLALFTLAIVTASLNMRRLSLLSALHYFRDKNLFPIQPPKVYFSELLKPQPNLTN